MYISACGSVVLLSLLDTDDVDVEVEDTDDDRLDVEWNGGRAGLLVGEVEGRSSMCIDTEDIRTARIVWRRAGSSLDSLSSAYRTSAIRSSKTPPWDLSSKRIRMRISLTLNWSRASMRSTNPARTVVLSTACEVGGECEFGSALCL
jgi:hypothetical protein